MLFTLQSIGLNERPLFNWLDSSMILLAKKHSDFLGILHDSHEKRDLEQFEFILIIVLLFRRTEHVDIRNAIHERREDFQGFRTDENMRDTLLNQNNYVCVNALQVLVFLDF